MIFKNLNLGAKENVMMKNFRASSLIANCLFYGTIYKSIIILDFVSHISGLSYIIG